jgi:hypothetical protein
MAGVATARDVEEVIQKLHSDRARVRDEGVKLLGTWLQGDRAASFCRLLGRNTARVKPGHGHLTGGHHFVHFPSLLSHHCLMTSRFCF